MAITHAIILYQAGIANVYRVDSGMGIVNPKRIGQGAFQTCEDFARGLVAAGVSLRVMSANVAGDATLQVNRWSDGLVDCPFRENARPPKSESESGFKVNTSWNRINSKPGFVSAWDSARAAYDAQHGAGSFDNLGDIDFGAAKPSKNQAVREYIAGL